MKTTIYWREYPTNKPQGFSGIYNVLTDSGVVIDAFWDSLGWTTTDKSSQDLQVTHFALPEDIVTTPSSREEQ